MEFQTWKTLEKDKLFDKNGKRKKRNYPHVGNKLNESDFKKISFDDMSGRTVTSYDFSPLIQIDKETRKYDESAEKWYGKSRPLTFSSHKDALLFSWFNFQLNNFLDRKISLMGLDTVVTAYRHGIGSNIEACKRALDFLNSNSIEKEILLLDISNFFGELDHKKLKDSWKEILSNEGSHGLPDDHYSIYKAVTRPKVIHINDVIRILKKRKTSQVMRLRRVCKKTDLGKSEWKSAIKDWQPKGIPQGLPISGVLANIYMLEFDQEMANFVKENNGYYSRYSDDIFLALPKGIDIENLIKAKIRKLNLLIKEEKTERLSYHPEKKMITNRAGLKKDLIYLGFRYDGKKVYIADKTISRFLSKIKNAVQTRVFIDIRKNEKDAVERAALYKRFSNIGSYPFGNYVNHASKVFGEHIQTQVSKIANPKFIKNLILLETKRQKEKMKVFAQKTGNR